MKKLGIVLALMLLSGCATAYHGKTQDISITTYPAGLTAKFDGKECVTPCKLEKVRRKEWQITLTSQRGEQFYYLVNKEFNYGAAMFGNCWNYVLPGMVIDMSNGSAYEILPVNIRVERLAREARND